MHDYLLGGIIIAITLVLAGGGNWLLNAIKGKKDAPKV